jgi:hypothetical protein
MEKRSVQHSSAPNAQVVTQMTTTIDCVMCFEPLAGESPHDHAEGVSGVTALPCAHSNHTACLRRWERRQTTCPVCRAEFDRFLNPQNGEEVYDEDDSDDDLPELEPAYPDDPGAAHELVVERLRASDANFTAMTAEVASLREQLLELLDPTRRIILTNLDSPRIGGGDLEHTRNTAELMTRTLYADLVRML